MGMAQQGMLKRRCRVVRFVRLIRVRRHGRKPVIRAGEEWEEEGDEEGDREVSARESASEMKSHKEANVNRSLVPLSPNPFECISPAS